MSVAINILETRLPMETMRFSFVNLAVPSVSMSLDNDIQQDIIPLCSNLAVSSATNIADAFFFLTDCLT
jgi:hypothetical protein